MLNRQRKEDGQVILIWVVFGLPVLLAMTLLVLGLGTFYLARNQTMHAAQLAATAGATVGYSLAGSTGYPFGIITSSPSPSSFQNEAYAAAGTTWADNSEGLNVHSVNISITQYPPKACGVYPPGYKVVVQATDHVPWIGFTESLPVCAVAMIKNIN
jgi:hypothetical protein